MKSESLLKTIVERAYVERLDAWQTAAVRIKHWLKEQQKGLLKDKDISRLDVDGHRIKDAARTLAKLTEKTEEDPQLAVHGTADVEDQIRDIVGVKVLCKSPRDQRMMFDALRDPEQLGSFELIEERTTRTLRRPAAIGPATSSSASPRTRESRSSPRSRSRPDSRTPGAN